MTVKQPLLLLISVLVLPVLLYFVFDRIRFLAVAKTTNGSVIEISSYNATCGSKRNRYSCTKYNAVVEFFTESSDRGELEVSAGSVRGYDQPISRANYHRGSTVPVRYNPKNPSQAYRDGWFDIWGTPFMTLVVQIATFFGAMSEPRRRYGGSRFS